MNIAIHSSLAAVVLAALAGGCGKADINGPGRCEPGATRSCDCPSEREGRQTCTADGEWDWCACPAPDASTDDVGAEEADLSPDPDVAEELEALPDVAGDPDAEDAEEEETGPSCEGVPPPHPYSHGECPVITGGPTAETSVNTDFLSAGDYRDFRFLVPGSYDGTEAWPLLFGWHWLNASSRSFVEDGELETAAEEMRMLIVLPDDYENADGDSVYWFNWPFSPTPPSTAEAREKEMTFFDDLLACVSEQYRVDPCRVHAVGVSAGALWLTYLSTTDRVDHLASIEVLSGGLADIPLELWHMEYFPQANKYPAVVLWGGPLDIIPPITFSTASQRYIEALKADGHFVVRCVHDSGHAVPPIDPPPDGGTRFRSLWTFFMDHPYGLAPGWSPYLASGLPADFPDWCDIVP